MIECTNVDMQDLLPEFVAEALSARERDAVELHLTTCSACRAEHEVLVAVRHARPVPPPMNIAAIVAALPRPVSAQQPELPVIVETQSTRSSFTVVRGGQSVAAPGTVQRSRSRVFSASMMRYAAALTLVAVGGLSMVVARSGPVTLTDTVSDTLVFSTDAVIELASNDMPYSPNRVPVQAVVSVAPSVLPIQELSDYSVDELTLLMDMLDAWDGAPSVDSLRAVPGGIDGSTQGS